MDLVRPKASKASFKSRTLQFGRIDDCYPSPNTYMLPLSDVYRRSKKPAYVKKTAPRFKVVSEAVPAPNTYSLPSTGNYKYRQTVHSTIQQRRPEDIECLAPAPNRYYLPKNNGLAKTFGRKDGHKRAVYLTVNDIWQ
uniref:Outer dense fiber protein 3 n=1 Tax=Schizaphis graminum TaxID=13262 RepID=A0A2S2PBU7_SCHGA